MLLLMNNKTALLLLACFIFGCTKNKTLSDLSDDAEPMMRAQASNDIVGFRLIRNAHVDWNGTNVGYNGIGYDVPKDGLLLKFLWTGNVEAEYINSVGGVSITNIPYVFFLVTNTNNNKMWLSCNEDDLKLAKDEYKEYEERELHIEHHDK
jgi:hypothetical protein